MGVCWTEAQTKRIYRNELKLTNAYENLTPDDDSRKTI